MTDKTSRRDALKALTAATGALSLAALPDEWTTPVINAGALPPHAQVSCIALTVVLQSNSDGTPELRVNQGPDPTSESGTPLEPGWTNSWDCQDDCLLLQLRNRTDGGTVVWRVTPIGESFFEFTLGAFESGFIIINLATGDYDTSTVNSEDLDPPPGCTIID